MDEDHDRIDKAWMVCRDWITQFDGSVTQAEFEGITLGNVQTGLDYLEAEVSNLRVLPIWRDEFKNPPVDLPSDGLIQKLAAGEVISLTVNYDILPEEDPVEIHLSVFMDAPGQVGISASWWADQVFPDGEEPKLRFESLFSHIASVQQALSAEKLYIGPESTDQPGEAGSPWIKV